MTNIAMIGLGNMGSGMCSNLVKAGHSVSAYDLNPEAIRVAIEGGAKGATSIADAVGDAEIVVTMLPAGKHVLEVYFGEGGIITAVPPGALFIDCSTIDVEDARNAFKQAEVAGFSMTDAPVSGGIAAATGGTLTFMVGGTEDGFARAKPILEAMGKKIIHAGHAGNGQVAKIANNMLLGISMIATCEAFELASRLGLDAQTFFDISSNSSGRNWSMTDYCPVAGPVPNAPSNNQYQPGFAVDMMLKDLRLARSASESSGLDCKLGELALLCYERLSNAGLGDRDFSVMMKHL